MSPDDPKKPATPVVPGEVSRGSGEGAATALKALIRKRTMVETPTSPAPSSPPLPSP